MCRGWHNSAGCRGRNIARCRGCSGLLYRSGGGCAGELGLGVAGGKHHGLVQDAGAERVVERGIEPAHGALLGEVGGGGAPGLPEGRGGAAERRPGGQDARGRGRGEVAPLVFLQLAAPEVAIGAATRRHGRLCIRAECGQEVTRGHWRFEVLHRVRSYAAPVLRGGHGGRFGGSDERVNG